MGETGLSVSRAGEPALVDAAYQEAMQAGGRDDGPRAMRLHFADGYYAENVIDLNGNCLEFVHKSWETKDSV